jgi:hypothetical protein
VYSGIEHSIDKISYKFATTDLGIIICSFQWRELRFKDS